MLQVVPFGPFLPDDFDASNEEDFVRLLNIQKLEAAVVFGKLFVVFILLPLLLFVFTLHLFFKKSCTL
jgi:hypothetical protein